MSDLEARLRAGLRAPSAEATAAIGEALARRLPPDATVALAGDLGAGKTTFVQGMARAWRVAGKVTSPSFTLYAIHEGERQLVHFDAYRLETSEAMDALMLEEFLRSPWCLAVEWPERIRAWLPGDARWLRFDPAGAADSARTIRAIDPPDAD